VGERAAAVALYEKFAADMRRELEVEPSTETQLLARELRSAATQTIAPRPTARVASRSTQVARVAAPMTALPSRRRRPPRVAIAAAVAVLAITAATRIAGSVSATMDPRRIRV